MTAEEWLRSNRSNLEKFLRTTSAVDRDQRAKAMVMAAGYCAGAAAAEFVNTEMADDVVAATKAVIEILREVIENAPFDTSSGKAFIQ